MRALRRFDHGGTHFEELSDKEKAFQRVVDAIAYTGDRLGERKYDVGDLLSVLQFTDVSGPSREFMDNIFNVSPEERETPQKKFRAFKRKDGSIRITSLDPETGKYNPAVGASALKPSVLSGIAGRPLASREMKEFKSLLMSEPAFIDYFIGIEEREPKKREFKNIPTVRSGSLGRKGVPGGGKGNVAGSRRLGKAQGDVGFGNIVGAFCSKLKWHPDCREFVRNQ